MEGMANRAEEIVVVGLCGSLGEVSGTRRALEAALEGARETGARTILVDFREWKLPFYGAPHGASQNTGITSENSDVERLKRIVKAAHGLIWATPEYHGSFSGVLKNALDLLSSDEIEGKMVGLVGVAGGSIGAINALNHLRVVARQLHAWVLPQQVSVAASWAAFEDDGSVKDEALAARLSELGRDVARFAFLHAQAEEVFHTMKETAHISNR